jgi:hypothetical protein
MPPIRPIRCTVTTDRADRSVPGLDSPPRIRHPGTGHGAGRRTGSTPVASNAGPVTTRSYPGPQFRGNPTPPRPSDCLGDRFRRAVICACPDQPSSAFLVSDGD